MRRKQFRDPFNYIQRRRQNIQDYSWSQSDIGRTMIIIAHIHVYLSITSQTNRNVYNKCNYNNNNNKRKTFTNTYRSMKMRLKIFLCIEKILYDVNKLLTAVESFITRFWRSPFLWFVYHSTLTCINVEMSIWRRTSRNTIINNEMK